VSDIVTRLYGCIYGRPSDYVPPAEAPKLGAVCVDAIEEIERLRALVAHYEAIAATGDKP
jgi:hypothetical protein